jgi:uncharacterized membrane protein YuzA (DUF378 family)
MAHVSTKDGCDYSTAGWWLLVLGGVNWGLVGIGWFMNQDINLLHFALGTWPIVENVAYIVIGIAAGMFVIGCPCQECKACRVGSGVVKE